MLYITLPVDPEVLDLSRSVQHVLELYDGEGSREVVNNNEIALVRVVLQSDLLTHHLLLHRFKLLLYDNFILIIFSLKKPRKTMVRHQRTISNHSSLQRAKKL